MSFSSLLFHGCISYLAQVGRLSLQPAPSLSRVAAVAPGHQPLDTTTVSLNNVFLHPSIFLLSSPPLISAFLWLWRRALIPVHSAFNRRHFLPENCLFLPINCDTNLWHSVIKLMWLCLCNSVLLLLNCPSGFLQDVGQNRKKAEWSKSKQASYLPSEICF